MDGVFKEFHVKVFNTGKLEIPGIQSEAMFQTILSEVIGVLQPDVDVPLYYRPNSDITVLINSNFNCGFFVNREALFDILKMKYNLQAIYDPCSYPGIQCKFYYNPDAPIQHGCQISEDQKHLYKRIKKVSFMVFRTGSVLIVGKCDEYVLLCIYEYLKMLLNNEYKHICQKTALTDKDKHRIEFLTPKVSTKKMRRRTIYVRNSLPRVVESEEEEAMECAC
jgi:TATA-box binding protein (TBP) (component of TFIID and TFIIIB)